MSAPAWPPLIRGERVPAWVRVRDVALTIAAWTLLAWWTRNAIALAWDYLSFPPFELSEHAPPDWRAIWAVLAPFFAIAAGLCAWLFVRSRRRRRVLTQASNAPQPAPLDVETQAAARGLSAGEARALQRMKIATVEFDADGRIVAAREG